MKIQARCSGESSWIFCNSKGVYCEDWIYQSVSHRYFQGFAIHNIFQYYHFIQNRRLQVKYLQWKLSITWLMLNYVVCHKPVDLLCELTMTEVARCTICLNYSRYRGSQYHNISNREESISYVICTPDVPGKFDMQKATALGVPKGPLCGNRFELLTK